MTTDVKDLVRAVETGAVQAQENPLTNLISFGLWRHHRHVSLSGHCFGVLLLVCPRDWYESLPAAAARLRSSVPSGRPPPRSANWPPTRTRPRWPNCTHTVCRCSQPHEIDRAAMRQACASVCASVRRDVPGCRARRLPARSRALSAAATIHPLHPPTEPPKHP